MNNMMSTFCRLIALSVLLFLFPFSALGWECNTEISGPTWVKIDRQITLTASGEPAGGIFSWYQIPNLVASGSTAILTGFQPPSSDYIGVGVKYTTPQGKGCSDQHWVYAHPCEASIYGPDVVEVGGTIHLSIDVCDSGGSYEWDPIEGLVPSGSLANFTGITPGVVSITATYYPADGDPQPASHDVSVLECNLMINGPAEILVNDTANLTATAGTSGGVYTWEPLDGLVGNGEFAEYVSSEPGEVVVSASYESPEGATCGASHNLKVVCPFVVEGPNIVSVGETILLNTSACETGGAYEWAAIEGLVPNNDSAQFTGMVPGGYVLSVTYSPSNGDPQVATHEVTVVSCELTLSGPDLLGVGETVSIVASTDISGGEYSWQALDGLLANDESAEFTGLVPGSFVASVSYLSPEGAECSASHTLTVEECSVELYGSQYGVVGAKSVLTAEGSPTGGTYQWTSTGDISELGATAELISYDPVTVASQVTYSTEKGTTCDSAIDTPFVGLDSLSGPSCVPSGTTLDYNDFSFTTEPANAGLNYMISPEISPLYFNTILQTYNQNVTASIGEGRFDDATTQITVVNDTVTSKNQSTFEVPNYFASVLTELGLAEVVNFTISNELATSLNCCGYSEIQNSTDSTIAVNLNVGVGPFTIVGIQMPSNVKKYISLDALALWVSSSGAVTLNGDHIACQDSVTWNGGGALSAGVEVGGQVKLEIEDIIVIGGKATGSTSIVESLDPEAERLKLSTSWGGLVGKVSGTVSFLGLDADFSESRTYFEGGSYFPIYISLPDLR